MCVGHMVSYKHTQFCLCPLSSFMHRIRYIHLDTLFKDVTRATPNPVSKHTHTHTHAHTRTHTHTCTHTHVHTHVHMHRYSLACCAQEASEQLCSVCSCFFTFSRLGLSCLAAVLWIDWSKSFCQFLSLSLIFLQECMGSRCTPLHPVSHVGSREHTQDIRLECRFLPTEPSSLQLNANF